MTHVVKRRGHKQKFDERKVYASVYAACLNTHMSHEEAEGVANKVASAVKDWVDNKEEVDSTEIFIKAGGELEKVNKDAAFMYTTHRDVS